MIFRFVRVQFMRIQFEFPDLPIWLTVFFIILKLCGLIFWSWIGIVSPIWITILIGFLVATILAWVEG